jgi:hypothetical protein
MSAICAMGRLELVNSLSTRLKRRNMRYRCGGIFMDELNAREKWDADSPTCDAISITEIGLSK